MSPPARRVPPAGTRAPLRERVAWGSPASRRPLADPALDPLFGPGARWAFTSGRGALAFLLELLRQTGWPAPLIAPAYTCPSVAAAAVRAGWSIALCDLDPDTLALDLTHLRRLTGDRSRVVLNAPLLGLPAGLAAIEAHCLEHGHFLIDDAAQTLGATEGGRPAGGFGQAGIFSFGRGKVVSTWHGGVLSLRAAELLPAAGAAHQTLPRIGHRQSAQTLLLTALAPALQHPLVFARLAAIPWLGVGRTIYDPSFDLARPRPAGERLLAAALAGVDRENALRRRHAARWADLLAGLEPDWATPLRAEPGAIHLRFGLRFRRPEDRDRAAATLRRAGLTAGPLYPGTLGDLPALAPHLTDASGPWPGAARLAAGLLTLPTNAYLRDADFTRAAAALGLDGRTRPPADRRSNRP